MGDYQMSHMRRRGMYRGDPGFFSVLGNIAKSAVGFIPGVGPIASKVLDLLTPAQKAARLVESPGAITSTVGAVRGVLKSGGAIIKKHPVLTGLGAAGAVAGASAGITHAIMRHGGGHRGKRMNVCNPRALRRAIRRTHAFAKLAMKTIHLVHPKKKARFGGFRKRRAKR